MADIVSDLAGKCGISPEMARKGLGVILALAKSNLAPETYAKISAVVPDADGLVATTAQAGQEASGGVLGAVTSAIGSLFGGPDVAAQLTQLGFSPEQLQAFLPKVMEFFKDKVPGDVMKQVSDLVPVPQEAAH